MLVNTPYDDVFKTLANDCKELLLPVTNEVFHEHYTGNEEIIFHPNEHFLNRQNGEEQERITDTCFEIIGDTQKKYHFECQSTEDSTMLIRMFEYDTQIALDDGKISDSTLNVSFPNSAVLYLRSTSNTPDKMLVHLRTPGGNLTYPIHVMKLKNYTIEDIFQKKLFFLIPFYIFVHESSFIEYNKDKQKLSFLLNEYEDIKNHLEMLAHDNVISEYVKCTIIDMSKKVLEHIAKKYEKVTEGVKSIMGGKVLEYEAKTILKKGIAQGHAQGLSEGLSRGLSQGLSQGRLEMLTEMVRDGFISIQEAAKRLNLTVEEFQSHLNN